MLDKRININRLIKESIVLLEISSLRTIQDICCSFSSIGDHGVASRRGVFFSYVRLCG